MSEENAPMSVTELKGNILTVQNVLRHIMKDGVHYGTIPGCGPKPTLLKPGAEKILATFHIGIEIEVEDYASEDLHIRYRVTAKGFHLPTGKSVGQGVGECSTSEEKYSSRGAVCPEEWEEADPLQRREKWTRNGSKIKQVRTNPSDNANTVLKMAKKRAVVDLCLSATACSDIFTQDIEDMPRENIVKNTTSQAPPATPQRKSAAGTTIAPGQVKVKLVKCDISMGKSGTGRDWIKYTYLDDSNRSYSTFSDTVAKICDGAIKAGLEANILFETTKYGANIIEITPAP